MFRPAIPTDPSLCRVCYGCKAYFVPETKEILCVDCLNIDNTRNLPILAPKGETNE